MSRQERCPGAGGARGEPSPRRCVGTCSQQLASPPVPRAFSLVCGTIKGLICTPKPPREALGGRRGGQEKRSSLESGCRVPAVPMQRWGTRTLLLLQEDFGVTTRPCSPLAGPQQVNASPCGVCALLSPRFSPQQSPAGFAASECLSKELHVAAALSSRHQQLRFMKHQKL